MIEEPFSGEELDEAPLPMSLQEPESALAPLQSLRSVDLMIARIDAMTKALKWKKEACIERRSRIFQRVSQEVASWLKNQKTKTVHTPGATYKRTTKTKGHLKAPRLKSDQIALVAFLKESFPSLITQEIVYEYNWSEAEPILIEHMLKTGELPFPGAVYDAPGDHLSITTIEKRDVETMAQEMLQRVQESEGGEE